MNAEDWLIPAWYSCPNSILIPLYSLFINLTEPTKQVYGDEDALKQLENEWERVSIQTNWKLEPCTMPVSSSTNDSSEPEFTPTGPSDHATANPSDQPDESTPINADAFLAQSSENGESGSNSNVLTPSTQQQ